MGRVPIFLNFLIAAFVLGAAEQSETVIVRPIETHDVLVNPGMGITTFQRFNGQPLNPGLKWSEEGPPTKLDAAPTPPDFPDTSISYCRWFWSAIQPEHGKYRWDIIDLALEEAREHRQTLAIRLMPYDQKHPLPDWYRNSGARRTNKPTDKDGEIWQPDFSDPLYLKYWGELVAEAGRRYDGHPYLDSVDISSVGYWGEGWSDYMPPFPYQKALIDIWLEAFKRTPLLMNFDQQEALTYGTQNGAAGAWIAWGTCAAPTATAGLTCWISTRSRLCGQGSRKSGSAVQSLWRPAGRRAPGSRKAMTWTTFWTKPCGGTSRRSMSSQRGFLPSGRSSLRNSKRKWATGSSCDDLSTHRRFGATAWFLFTCGG